LVGLTEVWKKAPAVTGSALVIGDEMVVRNVYSFMGRVGVVNFVRWF
jgi:hypothetical protein